MSNNYKLITEFYDNVISESYDDAISVLFTNYEIISSIIDKYIANKNYNDYDKLKNVDYDLYSLYYYYDSEENFDNILFIETEIIRLGILHICMENKMMTLNSKDEINNPVNNYDFNVLVAKTDSLVQLFFLFILIFNLEAYTNTSKYYVGIDFEFSARKIALMQMCFERESPFIWIVNPGEFTESQMNYIIKYLMIDTKINKIFHGSDSLDIPYVYQEMFKNDVTKIQLFTSHFVDTRFLCEYFRITVGQDKKCSIYDGLKYFGTITDEKYKLLDDINEKMQPVQDLQWQVRKMSSYHALYALYDVLFLKQFLLDIFKKAKLDIPQSYESFKYIIVITRFVFIEKKEISDISATAKKDTDPMNNYLIRKESNNITLITIMNQILENLVISKIGLTVNNLLGVNYIKSIMMTIFKKIIYYLIALNHKIYVNKQEIYKNTITLDDMYKKINELGFSDLSYLLMEFQKEVSTKLKLLY